MINDNLHVVHARAAGLDVHKIVVTATVRLCVGSGEPVCRGPRLQCSAARSRRPVSLAGVPTVSRRRRWEGTGVYWRTPWERLTERRDQGGLLNAHHVKQIKGGKTGC